MLKDLTIEKFLEDLSSNLPAPGGGAAAALDAACAAALTSMVFNLTIGKKQYDLYSDEIKKAIADNLNKAMELRDLFVEYIDKDAQAFNGVIAAYKMSKDNEKDMIIRNEAIEKGYILALEVPFELATMAYSLYTPIEIASEYGNKNVISDAAVAALKLQAAIESAVFNVNINLVNIHKDDFKEKVKNHCDKIVTDGRERKDDIIRLCYSKI